MNYKIVMCGNHEAGWEVIDFLLRNKLKIKYFVCLDNEKAKKHKISGYKSFVDLSEQYGIPIYYSNSFSLNDRRDIDFFSQHKFDLLVQGGWQRLFPKAILDTLRIGAIGVHGSSEFLPKGRGRSPINWSLIEGKKRFIMQYFIIKPGIDDGDIFHYEMFDITPWDDCKTLYYKNSIITKRVLLKFIPKLLSGDYNLFPQKGLPTYYPKRVPEDGKISWDATVFEIYNFIRAQTKPYPGAYSYIISKKIYIWEAIPFDTRISYPDAQIGEIVEIFNKGEYIVNCNSGLLMIRKCNRKLRIGEVFQNDI